MRYILTFLIARYFRTLISSNAVKFNETFVSLMFIVLGSNPEFMVTAPLFQAIVWFANLKLLNAILYRFHFPWMSKLTGIFKGNPVVKLSIRSPTNARTFRHDFNFQKGEHLFKIIVGVLFMRCTRFKARVLMENLISASLSLFANSVESIDESIPEKVSSLLKWLPLRVKSKAPRIRILAVDFNSNPIFVFK